jgi:hypothetical protein
MNSGNVEKIFSISCKEMIFTGFTAELYMFKDITTAIKLNQVER